LEQLDLSQFFCKDGQTERLKIPHTVTIVMGAESFECSGIVLAHHSNALRDMMLLSNEIYLDMFSGQKAVLEDCIDVLHGAEVAVDMDNIQGLLKFSKIFKVDVMFQSCLSWMTSNLKHNLCQFLKIGWYFAETGDDEVLEACTSYIAQELKTGLLAPDLITKALKLSKSVEGDSKTILFLLNKDLMAVEWSVLPVVTDWVESQEAAAMVLVRIDELDLYDKLCEIEDSAMEFIEKIHQFTQDGNYLQLRILNRLQHGLLKASKVKRVKISQSDKTKEVLQNMTRLIRNGDGSEALMNLAGSIDPFIYAEIAVAWVRQHGTKGGAKANIIKQLWSSINQKDLSLDFVWVLRNTVTCVSTRYKLPAIEKQVYKYTAACYFDDGTRDPDVGALLLANNFSMFPACNIPGCGQDTPYIRIPKLDDKVPCYNLEMAEDAAVDLTKYHRHKDLIKHWYFSLVQDGIGVLLSLVTNSYSDILARLALLIRADDELGVHCLEVKK